METRSYHHAGDDNVCDIFYRCAELSLISYRNYILNYLDRQNIAAAKLAGIMEDLNLSITQYNTVVSVLFAGYSKSAMTCKA